MKAWLVAVGVLAGCGEPLLPPSEPSPSAPAPSPRAAQLSEEDRRLFAQVDVMLERIGLERELLRKSSIGAHVLARGALLDKYRKDSEADLPAYVIESDGEFGRALGLFPPELDYVGSFWEIVTASIGGYYDPRSKTFYLLDDLPIDFVQTALAHELVHALQDQHFDLESMLAFRAGDNDRVLAAHVLCEGDATSSMYDITLGDSLALEVDDLRAGLVGTVETTPSGVPVPGYMQAWLVASYIDGFAMVKELRRRDDWEAVNAVFRDPPESTEQMLHLDKLDAREKPIFVPAPPVPDASWKTVTADVLGEQGLRMVLEQWVDRAEAAKAAAGWGGDRYVVARRGDEWALAWHVRFDSDKDAGEAQKALARRQPAACIERPKVGPMAWRRSGDALAIVAGPYRRAADGTVTSTSGCKAASDWLTRVVAAR
jgi:hypothetical protein